MNRFKRYRPSPAMIVACIALALSLGGTSYAAVVLPAGSVGTRQLKANAVIGSKVRNGSLTLSDISTASLSKLGRIAIASDTADAAAGAGARGVQGAITAPKTGFVLVTGWVDTFNANGQYYVRVWDDGASTHSPYYSGDYSTAGESTCGNTAVFRVAAGKHTFSLRIEGNAHAMSGWGTITAQFIPFGATGSPTVLGDNSRGAPQPRH